MTEPKNEKKLLTVQEKTPKRGRPRRVNGKYDPYDPRAIRVMQRRAQVKFLASMGCPKMECARIVGVHYQTFLELYAKEYDEGKHQVSMNVRKWQLDKAQEGCSTMLMYLGPVYCEEQRNVAHDSLTKDELTQGIDTLCALSENVKEENENGK